MKKSRYTEEQLAYALRPSVKRQPFKSPPSASTGTSSDT
jgi:hypothetical protein